MRNDTAKIKLSDDSREIYFDEGMSSHSLSKDASRRFMETMHDVDNMLLAELAGLTLDDLDVTLKKAVLHVMEMRHSLINDNSYYADNMRNYDLLLSNLALLHCYTIRSLLLAHIELGHININLTVDESNDVLGSMMQKDLTQLREEQAKKVQIVQPQFPQNDAENVQLDAPFGDDDFGFGDAFTEPIFDEEFKAFEEAERAKTPQMPKAEPANNNDEFAPFRKAAKEKAERAKAQNAQKKSASKKQK